MEYTFAPVPVNSFSTVPGTRVSADKTYLLF